MTFIINMQMNFYSGEILLNGFYKLETFRKKGVKLVGRSELHQALFYTEKAPENFTALF